MKEGRKERKKKWSKVREKEGREEKGRNKEEGRGTERKDGQTERKKGKWKKDTKNFYWLILINLFIFSFISSFIIAYCYTQVNSKHLYRKTTVLSCRRYLINTGVEKMNNISI